MQPVSGSAKGAPPPVNTPVNNALLPNKYKLSRVGRKLQISDDPRTLQALPKDVPERTWAEILQKEENEMVCFEIREEMLEAALTIGYANYMEKQNAFFTVHCAAMAWLRLLDWQFYRHDPGEEPSAYPPCFIPKRTESWIPDDMPAPSVKDSWGRQELAVMEECPDESLPMYSSNDDIDVPCVAPIPEQYWFPGKINLTTDYTTKDGLRARHVMDEEPKEDVDSTSDSALPPTRIQWEQSRNTFQGEWNYQDSSSSPQSLESGTLYNSSEMLQKVTDYEPLPRQRTKDPERRRPLVELVSRENGQWHFQQYGSSTVSPASSKIGAESEVLQKVTDYSAEEGGSTFLESRQSSLKPPSPVDGSLRGAGDSRLAVEPVVRSRRKTMSYSRASMLSKLPPLVADTPSRVSVISDCRLRNLRLETHYEVSTERLDPSEKETTRKKQLK